jgi:precorrin-3B synthase
MTGVAATVALRRATCPGLSVPMHSGDGLLARLRPTGTISPSAFAALCIAARDFGNGVMEITGRGSIQIRGLTAASAPRFADAVSALKIAADDGIPVHSDALAGLADEILDAGSVASELRATLAATSLPARLSPKISVVVDGDGALGLDNLAADVRLCADRVNGDTVFHVGVAGDEATATKLGVVAHTDGIEAVRRLLDVIARHGRSARARDVLATDGAAPFKAALAGLVVAPAHSGSRIRTRVAEPVGMHLLRDGSFACGVGLAFGHADARSLQRLTEVAKTNGARGIRVAAARALLIIGLTERTAPIVTAEAERLGLVVRADDPCRYVIACPGAPICASGHIAARSIAPTITEATQKYLDSDFRIHISGCAKSCAHAGAANLTIVGRADGCAVIADGSVHDSPVALATPDELTSTIAELARAAKGNAGHV